MTMKKTVWMLCITLLLTVLLVGCATTASTNTTADTQKQSEPAGSTPAPADSTSDPIESTSVPVDSKPAPVESTSDPINTTTDPVKSTTVPVDTTPDPVESTSEPVAADGMYMLVNGTRIELGMKYADVKEGLGAQTAPDQELGSCDDPTFVRIVHFYPSLTVTENPDGTIWGIELSSMYAGEGDAALKGKVKLGTTLDEALAALGEPDNSASIKDDCMLNYQQDGQIIYIFLDADSNNTVSGISMTLT